jgi:FtsP/CotA-like multicopper oxidase with cupredoxin domain
MEGDEMVMEDAPDDGLRPGVVVADLLLTDTASGAPNLTEGAPVLAALGRSVGHLPDNTDTAWVGADAMVLSERMDMVQDADGVWQMTTDLYVDGATWRHPHGPTQDPTQDPPHTGPHTPEAPTARHARLGQTLLWELRNESAMAHPVHLHGFSYQPLYFERHDEAGVPTRWELGYDEMEDTTVLPGHTSLFIRMRLEDRVGDGGALGRWMRHCHIMQHGEAGMMSEFIVGP